MKISYTDEEVAEAAKRERVAEGRYRLVLADLMRQVSKENGHLMLRGVYRILSDPNDAGSTVGPKLNNYLCLPFRNPDREDHVPSKFFATNTNRWLAAHLPEEVPLLPGKNADGQLEYKGEEISWDDNEEMRKEALDATYAKAGEIWEDESNESLEALKNTVVYANVYYQEGSDFPSMNNFSVEAGEEELIVGEGYKAAPVAVADEEEEEEEVEVKAKKAASKPAAKTNGKAAHKPVAKANGKKK